MKRAEYVAQSWGITTKYWLENFKEAGHLSGIGVNLRGIRCEGGHWLQLTQYKVWRMCAQMVNNI
jgi:hypothetical protein